MWRDCSEEKQAEFLVKDFFPWDKVESIGVRDATMLRRVEDLLTGSGGSPPRVDVCPHWYYT